jgi:hypothetical protein
VAIGHRRKGQGKLWKDTTPGMKVSMACSLQIHGNNQHHSRWHGDVDVAEREGLTNFLAKVFGKIMSKDL